jgi:hypothetical protein
MIVASFQDYVPLADITKIIAVCLTVAVVAPTAAALVITGFEAQASASESVRSRVLANTRIALGVAIVVAMITIGLYALSNK